MRFKFSKERKKDTKAKQKQKYRTFFPQVQHFYFSEEMKHSTWGLKLQFAVLTVYQWRRIEQKISYSWGPKRREYILVSYGSLDLWARQANQCNYSEFDLNNKIFRKKEDIFYTFEKNVCNIGCSHSTVTFSMASSPVQNSASVYVDLFSGCICTLQVFRTGENYTFSSINITYLCLFDHESPSIFYNTVFMRMKKGENSLLFESYCGYKTG